MTDQDEQSRAANRDFFTHEHEWYAAAIAELATYRYSREALNNEVAGTHLLLDIGNGGAFDYDTNLVDQIIAVDLFVEDLPRETFPPNVTPKNGDALALNEESDQYDAVLLAMLLHHLSGPTVDAVLENTQRAFEEAFRVLKPGGRIIVLESCVPRWFYRVERTLYPALRRISGTKLLRHPPVLQMRAPIVADLLNRRFDSLRWHRLPVGPFILQFGWRFPTALTPARPYLFVANKT